MEDLKLLDLIGRLSKKDLTIELPNKRVLSYKKPKKVSISALFFRHGACKRCGRSCNVGFNLYWCQDEYQDLIYDDNFRKKLRPFQIKVNGKEKILVRYKNPTEKTPACDLVTHNGKIATCGIHDIKPIHCALNPIHIDQKKENTIITKRMFGRNFKFGCPMKWKPFNKELFKSWDLPLLERLWSASNYLEIPTFLEEIVPYLSSTDWNKNNLPEENVIIVENKHNKIKK